MHILIKILAPALLLALAGCATIQPEQPAATKPGQAFSFPGGGQIDEDTLGRTLARSRLVIVGESHRHPGHHQTQARMLGLLATGREPSEIVVGIEWLDHTHTQACAELSQGEITVKEFAEKVDWDDAWGYPLELYAPILEMVRHNHYKLVPLNAPAKVIRHIGRKGLASLSPAERGQIAAELDLDDPAYKKQISAQLPMHAQMGSGGLDNFFAAQVARDETMAQKMAEAMSPWPDGGKAGIVFTGLGHMTHGRGLPPRLSRRLPGEPVLLIVPIEPGTIIQSDLMLSAKPADILIVSTPEPPRPPRLGVFIEPVKAGLEVKAVVPGSAADSAGVQKGDILLEMGGVALKTAKDIHNAVKNNPNAKYLLKVRRGDEIVELLVSLKAL